MVGNVAEATGRLVASVLALSLTPGLADCATAEARGGIGVLASPPCLELSVPLGWVSVSVSDTCTRRLFGVREVRVLVRSFLCASFPGLGSGTGDSAAADTRRTVALRFPATACSRSEVRALCVDAALRWVWACASSSRSTAAMALASESSQSKVPRFLRNLENKASAAECRQVAPEHGATEVTVHLGRPPRCAERTH